jgi:hypothetical protein
LTRIQDSTPTSTGDQVHAIALQWILDMIVHVFGFWPKHAGKCSQSSVVPVALHVVRKFPFGKSVSKSYVSGIIAVCATTTASHGSGIFTVHELAGTPLDPATAIISVDRVLNIWLTFLNNDPLASLQALFKIMSSWGNNAWKNSQRDGDGGGGQWEKSPAEQRAWRQYYELKDKFERLEEESHALKKAHEADAQRKQMEEQLAKQTELAKNAAQEAMQNILDKLNLPTHQPSSSSTPSTAPTARGRLQGELGRNDSIDSSAEVPNLSNRALTKLRDRLMASTPWGAQAKANSRDKAKKHDKKDDKDKSSARRVKQRSSSSASTSSQ